MLLTNENVYETSVCWKYKAVHIDLPLYLSLFHTLFSRPLTAKL